MNDEIRMRASSECAITGMRLTTSHKTAPPNRPMMLGVRPSNTRAPVQVAAKAVNRTAFDKSMEIHSGADPNMPNSTTEAARSRCAEPHQATAVIAEFWTHANNSNNPSIAST